ncbi:MAG: hypothetical protein NXH93_21310 [Rhodobacteraceae bacterium]|nr:MULTISPECIES: hypothetical protein [Marivita]MCR9170824.1 hypothetical protein [Paracoccaceae bacterium]
MTPQEETVILEARDILGRYLSQNPVIGSWQALMDYCALTVRGSIERFHVLYLDRKNRIIADELLLRIPRAFEHLLHEHLNAHSMAT